MESESMLTPRGKYPLPEKKILLRGGSNPRRCVKQDSEPNALLTTYSGPSVKDYKSVQGVSKQPIVCFCFFFFFFFFCFVLFCFLFLFVFVVFLFLFCFVLFCFLVLFFFVCVCCSCERCVLCRSAFLNILVLQMNGDGFFVLFCWLLNVPATC